MRPEPNTRIERHRIAIPASLACRNTNTGAFLVPFNGSFLQVIASDGGRWEHVSVVVRGENRTPTWEELSHIKSLWWDDAECVVQYHPPNSEYINNHPYCLHLWRPTEAEIPLPPTYMVGLKELNPQPTGVPQ